jgi:pimeloyl-ACP methyl ester carboxylesterase
MSIKHTTSIVHTSSIRRRHRVATRFGRASYLEAGAGPVALYVHGVFLSADLWRHQLEGLGDLRRGLAVDLLAHGQSVNPGADRLTIEAQVQMVMDVLDGLGIDQVDLVGNDSGGAIVQLVAARAPERVRSLVLTNCDTHDNWPPEAFRPIFDLARAGGLADAVQVLGADPGAARAALASGFEDPDALPDDIVSSFLAPFAGRAGAEALQAYVAGMDSAVTVAVRDDLARFDRPTLIAWGTGDDFFDVRWAHWLAETIPGTVRCVELDGAKLFFPLERPAFTEELRAFWSEEVPVVPGAA